MGDKTDKADRLTFWRGWWEGLRHYPDAERLAIYDAILAYAFEGEEPAPPAPGNLTATIVYSEISHIRETIGISRARRQAGAKGGSKRQANTKQTPSTKQRRLKQTATKSKSKYKNKYKNKIKSILLLPRVRARSSRRRWINFLRGLHLPESRRISRAASTASLLRRDGATPTVCLLQIGGGIYAKPIKTKSKKIPPRASRVSELTICRLRGDGREGYGPDRGGACRRVPHAAREHRPRA